MLLSESDFCPDPSVTEGGMVKVMKLDLVFSLFSCLFSLLFDVSDVSLCVSDHMQVCVSLCVCHCVCDYMHGCVSLCV